MQQAIRIDLYDGVAEGLGRAVHHDSLAVVLQSTPMTKSFDIRMTSANIGRSVHLSERQWQTRRSDECRWIKL